MRISMIVVVAVLVGLFLMAQHQERLEEQQNIQYTIKCAALINVTLDGLTEEQILHIYDTKIWPIKAELDHELRIRNHMEDNGITIR